MLPFFLSSSSSMLLFLFCFLLVVVGLLVLFFIIALIEPHRLTGRKTPSYLLTCLLLFCFYDPCHTLSSADLTAYLEGGMPFHSSGAV